MLKKLSKNFSNIDPESSESADSFMDDIHVHATGCGIYKTDLVNLDEFAVSGFLMVFYKQGSVKIKRRNGETILKPGSFYIFSPYDIYSGTRIGKEQLIFFYIQFDISPFLGDIKFKTDQMSPDMNVFSGKEYFYIGQLMEQIVTDYSRNGKNPTVLNQFVHFVADQVIHDELGEKNSPDLYALTNEGKLVDHTLQYVFEHISEPNTIWKISQEIGTSKTSLDRAFKRVLNMTPKQAFTRLKLERSIQMMNDDIPLKKIAKELGFSSVYHFSNTFKNVIGTRPTDYRNKKLAI